MGETAGFNKFMSRLAYVVLNTGCVFKISYISCDSAVSSSSSITITSGSALKARILAAISSSSKSS